MRTLPIGLSVRLIALLAVVASAEAPATRESRTSSPRREAFLKLIDRPRVDPAVQISDDGTHFSFMSEAGQRVPGILVQPIVTRNPSGSSRLPVVIALHGTGGTKESLLPVLHALADKGFLAVAIDGRYHGERTTAGKGSAEYQEAILRAWREPGREHPFYFDTTWDVSRVIDYLATRDDVDPKRIGLIGISKGGIETYLAAAADERIACAVPCIGVQSFRWALEHDAWQPRVDTIKNAFETAAKEANVATPDAAFVRSFYERVSPGIASEFDGPAMLPLIAPRPLMVINGDADNRTPLPGLKECTDAAEAAYRDAGVADHFVVRIEEKTGHKVTPESQTAAVEWFAKWLMP